MGESRDSEYKLLIIKVLHTVIWALFVIVILYILYSGITNSISIITWTSIVLIVFEGITLLVNGWQCPLTKLGEKYTDQADVGFDIFLPRWLAKNNKTMFTTLYLIGVIMVIYRLIIYSV